jgi:hypothetical protein
MANDEQWGDEAACNFADMLLSMRDWVNRRVESIQFMDDEAIVRRNSVDLTLPEKPAPLHPGTGEWLVPLAFISKRPLIGLDVRGAHGEALPVLTTSQNGTLAVVALHAIACSDVTTGLGAEHIPAVDEIVPLLNTIVFGEPSSAAGAYEQLKDLVSAAHASGLPLGELAETGFLESARTFVENFVMVAVIRAEPHSRTIAKFQYVTDIRTSGTDERSTRERLADRMGWTPSTYEFDIPGADTAGSFHFELTVPDGAAISEGAIYDQDQEEQGLSIALGREGRQIIHMVAPATPSNRYRAQINIRASQVGWLRTCRTAAWAIALLMLASAARLDSLVDLADDASRLSVDVAAILLTLVATLAAFVVRMGEHALTSRLLFWVRATILLVVGQPFVAAWLLAFGPVGTALHVLWWAAAVVSLGGAAALERTYRGPELLHSVSQPER